jgi:hypothetical protein
VGFWSSTGIASDVGDVRTATEARVCVVTGFVHAAGWGAGEVITFSAAGSVGEAIKDPAIQESESIILPRWISTGGWDDAAADVPLVVYR